ncbi:YopX family protein [Paenibacillus peoriae]|uniref:YopX family protein n=1 Tax=Paenibacillus peoriae TaxID=59893 RepID=UPI0032AF27B4
MSRPIKFRKWDKDLKRMHVCGEDVRDSIIFDDNNEAYYYNEAWYYNLDKDKAYELMQYTGLKDRNGKEIYEGDILAFKNKNMRNGEILGYMKYDESRACWTCTKTLDDEVYGMPYFEECDNGIHENDYVEVIGNIYENPLDDTP